MDYSCERRHRRRQQRSTSFHDVASSRDDDDDDDDHHIEQEIIERAMEIERSRERSLRRQLEYIVYNVKKLERRRRHRHRTRSPEYYRKSGSPSCRRSFDAHSHRDSSPDQFYQEGNIGCSESRNRSKSARSKRLVSCQVTMAYQGVQTQRLGDEIMVLQGNLIVFKGFLRPQDTFTFKFERDHRQLVVKLEFFINDLFECCLSIDCEREHIDDENGLFQLQMIQSYGGHSRDRDDENERCSSESDKTNSDDHSRRHRYHHRSISPTTNGQTLSTLDSERRSLRRRKPQPDEQSPPNSMRKDRQGRSRDSAKAAHRAERSPVPPPPELTLTKQSDVDAEKASKTKKRKETSSQTPSTVSRQPTSKIAPVNDKKATFPHLTSSVKDDDRRPSLENVAKKPSYDELLNTVGPCEEKQPTGSIEKSEFPADRTTANDDEDTGDRANVTNFLELLQAISGAAIQISSNNDDGDEIQGLLARLGIVTQTNNRKHSAHTTPRLLGNVENFLIVYLDVSGPDNSLITRLRALVNYVKVFDDVDDCIAFINNISNEKIIFVVSDLLGDPIVSRIQDLEQLFAIYVLCQSKQEADDWSTNQPKIRRIAVNIDEIVEQIQVDIERDEQKSLSFTVTVATTNATCDRSFIKRQILKEILLDGDDINEEKKELVDFCRREYEDNVEQLKHIQHFEDQYRKENVLDFFGKEKFIYKMLSKAFRIPEVDILFKLRLFIQNLHNFIVSSPNNGSLRTIYRLQDVTTEELDKLRACADGGFIGFSGFFLASTSCPEQRPTKPVSSMSRNGQADDEMEQVIFHIDVSSSNIFMCIDPSQVLVTFGLVTRIKAVDKDKSGTTIFHLKVVGADDQQLERVVEPMRRETRASHPSLRIVKLFIELEQYSQAVHLGQILLADLPHGRKDPLFALARIYHSLGTVLYEKEEYDQALDVIKKSHELYLRFLPEDAPQLSPTWNNMGSIYLRQGKTDLALEYHEKALSIQLKSPSPDLPSIVSYSNNIGGVYLKLERYDEALVHFKRALQIEEQTLPANHPELSGTYHRIGGVYFRQNNYEKALEFYDKTLEIELATLPDNHPTVAVTYHNRGTAFEGMGRLQEAVDSAEKAVERLLKTMPKEHPQVRMNLAYVERLKKKLWVKELFTS